MAVTVTQRVEAPIEKTFAVYSDVTNAAGRIKGIRKIELLTPGPVGVGTKFRETRIMFGKEATETMEFSVYEPNRRYDLTADSCGALYRTEFRFEPDGTGTRVTATFGVEARSFVAKLFKPLAWLMRGMMKKCLQQDMDDLKAAAEGEGVRA
jgi:carbon monoxide dehydrogenase subunit G